VKARLLLFASWALIAVSFWSLRLLDVRSDPVTPFLSLMLLASLAWLGGGWSLYKTPKGARPRVRWILLGGLLLRLVAWSSPYILETDIHRYLWDGFVLSRGFNPYQFAPATVQAAADPTAIANLSSRDQELIRRLWLKSRSPNIRGYLKAVNAPEIPTCYPPLTEFAFAAMANVAPGNPRAWKGLVVLADMLLCLVTLGLLTELGRDPHWVFLYAWCPLPLKEYANTGHFDPFATLFTALAILLLLRKRPVLAGTCLGLGIATKLYPLILLPLLARRLGLRGMLPALILPPFLLTPFLGIGLGVFEGLRMFARVWQFNSSLFMVLWLLLGKSKAILVQTTVLGIEIRWRVFHLVKGIVGIFYLAFLFWIYRRPDREARHLIEKVLLALLGLLLLSPVTDPWYLPWVLPYACLLPSSSVTYLAVGMFGYYLYFLGFQEVWWHRVVEYLPFYALTGKEIHGGSLFGADLGTEIDNDKEAP
jgi:hypothetical protein